jgi:hypothetical protein
MKKEKIKLILASSFLAISFICIIIEIILFSGIATKKQNGTSGSSFFVFYNVNIAGDDPSKIKEALLVRNKFLERAFKIREALRPLSLKHKLMIQKMLSTADNSMTSFDLLYDQLPKVPTPEFFQSNPGVMNDPLMFGWGVGDPFSGDDPTSPQTIRGKQLLRSAQISRFNAFHDLPISMSSCGVNTITVWISGRVTETSRWKNRDNHTVFVDQEELNNSKSAIQNTQEGRITTIKEPFEFYTK